MRPTVLRTTAALVLVADLLLVLVGVYLALHFEATPVAVARAEKGQAVGVPAGIAVVAAVVTLVAARRRWAVVVLVAAALLTAVSVVVLVVRDVPTS